MAFLSSFRSEGMTTLRSLRPGDVGMAFFWACSMLTFRSSVLLSGDLDTPLIQTIIVVASFTANMTVLILVSFWIESRDRSLGRRLPVAALILTLAGLAGIALTDLFQRPLGDTALGCLVGASIVTGAGYGLFWGSWAEKLGKKHPTKLALIMPLVFMLSAALFLVVSILSSDPQTPSVALLAILVVASYLMLLEKEHGDPLVDHTVRMANSRPAFISLFDLMALSIIVSFLFGFMWESTVLSIQSVNDAHRMPMFANLALSLVLVAIALCAKRHIDFDMAYRFIIPTVIGLFAILPLFGESNPVFMNALTTLGYGFFDVTMMYVAFSTAYDRAASGFFVGGLIRAISIFSRLAGIGIGFLGALATRDQQWVAILSVSAASMYGLLLAWMIYRKGGARRSAFHTAQNADDAPAAEPIEDAGSGEAPTDPLDRLSEDFSLTRREAEVLPYLAQGRSAKAIAAELFVSESTVRTHTRKIYEKADLHSREDLFALIKTYENNDEQRA